MLETKMEVVGSVLRGENGARLVLGTPSIRRDTDVEFPVLVQTDWFAAVSTIRASPVQLIELSAELRRLSNRTSFLCNFINDDGNFEINLSVRNSGAIDVRGFLSPSLAVGSSVKFEFESALSDLALFAESFCAAVLKLK